MQKFYFHDALSTAAGTLPGSTTLSATKATPDVTATGASNNRSMDGTPGVAQTSIALSTLAQTAHQDNWFLRFISPPLAAQTIAIASTWQLHEGAEESNTNSNFNINGPLIAIWRPSTGALVGRIADATTSGINALGATGEQALSSTALNGSAITILDGDLLVIELFGGNTQGVATSYTNTIYYDGTTDDNAASNAAFLRAPADLPLYVPSAGLQVPYYWPKKHFGPF